jgi:probable HAF family extracellular repeat protein
VGGFYNGESYSAAFDINPAGKVVGVSFNSDVELHVFLWEKGVMSDLGTLGGSRTVAKANNAAGRIVGWGDVSGGTRATLWTVR